MTGLTRADVEAALIPRAKPGSSVTLLAGVVTDPRMVDLGDGPLIVDGPTGPVGQQGYVLNVGGHRHWLPHDGTSPAHLAALTALTDRVTALEAASQAGAWTACTLNSGVTGWAMVRRLSPTMAEIALTLDGNLPEGNTSLCTVPAALRPVATSAGASDARIAGYMGGAYPATLHVAASGTVGVTQRSGAARTNVQARGTYGLT